MSRQKHVRRARLGRFRKSSRFLAFLAAQGARLASSATGLTVALVHTSNNDATGVLTATSVPGDGNTVTIGTKTYAFKTALTSPAVANEVLIELTASDSLDNLIAAIGAGSGAGTKYGTGTTANADATAAAGAGDTVNVTAKAHGTDGNLVATTRVGSPLSWGAATLAGGVTEAFGPTISASTHGLKTGDGPFVLTAATTLPTGYVAGKESWVIKVDADTFKLSGSAHETATGQGIQTFGSAGVGTLTLKRPVTKEGILNLLRRNTAREIATATDIDALR